MSKQNRFRSSTCPLKHSFYVRWKNIKSRCCNPNCKAYKDYGGRGISICQEWLMFKNFEKDMYQSFCKAVSNKLLKEVTIDRIDNSKGYFKENCTWATHKQQSLNRRKSLVFTINGVRKSLVDWSHQYGCSYTTAYNKVKKGYNLNHALKKHIPLYTYRGETTNQAAKRLGLSSRCVYDRIHRHGWSIKNAFTTPTTPKKDQA